MKIKYIDYYTLVATLVEKMSRGEVRFPVLKSTLELLTDKELLLVLNRIKKSAYNQVLYQYLINKGKLLEKVYLSKIV